MSIVKQFETYQHIEALTDRQLMLATTALEAEVISLTGKISAQSDDNAEWRRRAEQALKSIKLRLSWAEREARARRAIRHAKDAASEAGVFNALVRKQLGDEAYVRLWDEARRIAKAKETA